MYGNFLSKVPRLQLVNLRDLYLNNNSIFSIELGYHPFLTTLDMSSNDILRMKGQNV